VSGITDDELRTITEMMAKGTYAAILLATKDLDGTFARLQASDAEVVQSRPNSRTGFATAPSAIPRAPSSASRSCAEPSGDRAMTCTAEPHPGRSERPRLRVDRWIKVRAPR